MPKFSQLSQERLATCDIALRQIFYCVIEHWDCTILEGHRGEEAQNAAYAAGKSKVQYPYSKHNHNPSLAVDVMPYPVDWNDLERLRRFSDFVKGVAAGLGYDIKWGGDFNGFFDGPHWELI